MVRRDTARARARLQEAVRRFLTARGFEEVETPCLVAAPGMEPHVDAFPSRFVPEGGGAPRPLWLHTSPEYAMKRLVAEGFPRIFQLARVFRNGEVSATHNAEFTMLELYRAGTDYAGIMSDLEQLVAHCAAELTGGTRVRAGGRDVDFTAPFRRVTIGDAFGRAGIDLAACAGEASELHRRMAACGLEAGSFTDSYDDLFFRVFLERVEPELARQGPTYLVDWPAPMAALARLKPGDPRWAERFELYAGGLELANGFSELTDAVEQRARLEAERALRERLGRPAYPLDERFLAALPHLPPCGGVALGLDRLLMLLTGARAIEEVLLFPSRELLE
jgi:elongation factor P--(R)-beta-lysine ligase